MADNDIALMAHLLRRAGFGASRDDIEASVAKGYQATVEELLNPETQPGVEEDLMFRYNQNLREANNARDQQWVYRMINSPRQLQEKVALFWHTILCAGNTKIDSGYEMHRMINMFREKGMGSFRDLIVELSKTPGMVYYLDNSESHKTAVNENYGRELLELFTMGVGMDGQFNYSEADVKVCARAFTGWNVAPAYPPFPYGRSRWQFRYDPADHDDSEKTFLGETGRWNGEDIIQIVCKQPGTARFIARHMYDFFVADEPPVPAWRLTPPRDTEAIRILEQAYFDSGYNIKAMLQALFTSDFFKSETVRYQKVKSPAEVVAGTLRLVGEHRGEIKPGLFELAQEPKYMGMNLMDPPTVEGWHTGREWIDSGTLVERINFVADMVGRTGLPGVQSIIKRLMARGRTLSPEQLVDGCLDLMGPVEVDKGTRNQLLEHALTGGALRHGTQTERAEFTQRTGEMLQMIAATAEYQFA
jgi:uncharacterized protein (DUF1800 family)